MTEMTRGGLKITSGQRSVSSLIVDLTGQTLVLPVILTGHFWKRKFNYSFRTVALNELCTLLFLFSLAFLAALQ